MGLQRVGHDWTMEPAMGRQDLERELNCQLLATMDPPGRECAECSGGGERGTWPQFGRSEEHTSELQTQR